MSAIDWEPIYASYAAAAGRAYADRERIARCRMPQHIHDHLVDQTAAERDERDAAEREAWAALGLPVPPSRDYAGPQSALPTTLFGIPVEIDDTVTEITWDAPAAPRLTVTYMHSWMPTSWEVIDDHNPDLAQRIPEEHRTHQFAIRAPNFDRWRCATCDTGGDL